MASTSPPPLQALYGNALFSSQPSLHLCYGTSYLSRARGRLIANVGQRQRALESEQSGFNAHHEWQSGLSTSVSVQSAEALS